jgi:hypothetical protein
VELGEEKIIPGRVYPVVKTPVLPRILYEALYYALRLVEQGLPTDLALLYVVHHAVAAWKTMLQLPLDHGQLPCVRGDLLEEPLRCAETQLEAVEGVPVLDYVLDVSPGRASAVVANAVEAHRVAQVGVGRFGRDHDLSVEVVGVGDVVR